MPTTILWFRRDLRRSDHPALVEAARAAGPDGAVVPLFCVDPALMGPAGANRRAGNPGPEGSIAKLLFAEVNMRIYELCVDLLGADGLVGHDYTMRRSEQLGLIGPPGSGRKMFLRSRANSIEGGTSEIQRNILGERVLGLPGEPRDDKDRPWIDVPRS